MRPDARRISTPFWCAASSALIVRGLTVLDYGCGAGENSVLIAMHGAEKVVGVDISPELIELGRQRLALHGFAENTEFRVGSAHELPLEDESIDVVFGMAILHHLDLQLASNEVFRVLKNLHRNNNSLRRTRTGNFLFAY